MGGVHLIPVSIVVHRSKQPIPQLRDYSQHFIVQLLDNCGHLCFREVAPATRTLFILTRVVFPTLFAARVSALRAGAILRAQCSESSRCRAIRGAVHSVAKKARERGHRLLNPRHVLQWRVNLTPGSFRLAVYVRG